MIRQIQWAESDFGAPESPFMTGALERKLKITFHSESLVGATPINLIAIDTLRRFTKMDKIEAADTQEGDIPHLRIGDFDLKYDDIEVELRGKGLELLTGIKSPRQWLEMARKLAGSLEYSDPEVRKTLESILIARAQKQIDHDLLITLSPELLQNRSKSFIADTNPCSPSEAVKIVGLYLRYRECYVIEVSNGGGCYLDKGLFYWVLARHRLPRMWKYFSACVHSDQQRRDGIGNLGASILTRCVRALEDRDKIGYHFYSTQGNSTRDSMMYHFDYLTLLLSGVFDSMALVARKVYSMSKSNERDSKFQHSGFITALDKAGARKLHGIITHQSFKALMIMLKRLRNTIHCANLTTVAYKEPVKGEKSFVILDKSIAGEIWDASKEYSNPDEWGLFQSHDLLFEPYTYASTLTQECLKFINRIANATDVVKLFSSGAIPELSLSSPVKGCLNKWTRKRVHIIG